MKWILVGLFLVWSGVAFAAPLCGEREEILKQLEERFSEVVRYVAVSRRGALIELTVAPDGGWSMLVTTPPNGPTCIMVVGENWQEKRPLKKTGVRI